MIIDAKTIAITLVIVGIASYFGLQLIRSFALSIAQENHDANLATDLSIGMKQARREQEADAAAMAAFAKVEPLISTSLVNKGIGTKAKVYPVAVSTLPVTTDTGLRISVLNNNKIQEKFKTVCAVGSDSIDLLSRKDINEDEGR